MKKTFLSIVLALSFGISHATDALVFPAGFKKGVAFSGFQNGGLLCGESNWTEFEKQTTRINAKKVALLSGAPVIAGGQKIGISADFYKHAIEDITRIKELGCNAVRFSIEWADIEPQEGIFNQDLLHFWRTYCVALRSQGIEPMVTLYHWVHPLWFDKRGGFERATNIAYFVRFVEHVCAALGDVVSTWCTINEPTVIAGCGYILGIHAPGHFLKLQKAGIVLKNLLLAHVAAYKKIKSLPGGDKAEVGFAHALLLFGAYEHETNLPFLGTFSWSDPLSRLTARMMTFAFGHHIVKRFFTEGIFEFATPFTKTIRVYCPEAVESLDFLGLNFYSEVVCGPHPTCYPHQTMTEMEYPIWPEKMYDALIEVLRIGKPIYITENGLSDAKDTHRPQFIIDYLGAVKRALDDGCDVRGYYHWTLMDNFEWQEGFDKKFGLYQVDYTDPHRTRTPRQSAFVYRDLIKIAEKN